MEDILVGEFCIYYFIMNCSLARFYIRHQFATGHRLPLFSNSFYRNVYYNEGQTYQLAKGTRKNQGGCGQQRKKAKRCTRCSMDNHTWGKFCKPILVAATLYRNRGTAIQPFKPRTSTLAVHQPPPPRQEQPAKVNIIQ